MCLKDELTKCQNILYEGFISTTSSGIEWLNNFCANFLKFCNQLHKFLIFDCNQKDVIIEICFLCITQVIRCVKYMEKTIKLEENQGIVLASSRQYFLDRILWCFARLKSTLNSANDDVVLSSLQESNFMISMDSVLDMIEPYSALEKVNIQNIAEYNAQAMFVSQKIRSTVDILLSQTLAFANVTLNDDKIALTALCQKVLRECIAFQEECSLNEDKSCPSEHNRQLKAVMLENSLYQLEDFLNESLLRLVYKVMVDCSIHSVDKLRHLIRNKSTEDELDNEIADFDVNVDRIMQIGIFAMAFAVDIRAKTTVRSCLASLESLDSVLIPSLYSHCETHATILEEHYHEEVKKFQDALQEIIDTSAFCTSYREILSECIKNSEKEFNTEKINEILEMGKILDDHFLINSYDIFTDDNNGLKKKCYDRFNIMLNECLAIIACADQVENSRIIKRLKIFNSILKKLKESVDKKNSENEDLSVSKKIQSNELYINENIFETFGITPSCHSILYNTKKSKDFTDSLKGNYSKMIATPGGCNSSGSRKVKKRVSLRVAIFKRQQHHEIKNVWSSFNEQSTSLQITDILDQITNLSSTFTKEVGT